MGGIREKYDISIFVNFLTCMSLVTTKKEYFKYEILGEMSNLIDSKI